MKILMFGRSGQVASEMARHRSTDLTIEALGRGEADLCDPEGCAALIRTTDADIILNAAAYTDVEKAEREAALAMAVNATAPAAMAAAAARRKLPFLHVSSDYVFDGSGEAARAPDAPTAPINAYGRSKHAGEAGIRACGGRYLILRTSWVFSAHGTNFVKTMLRLGRQRDRLGVVADQVGGPTAASDIAEALLLAAHSLCAANTAGGIHHFSGAPDVSWADFAREIFRRAELPVAVDDIATSDFPTEARRPLNSRLDCDSFTRAFGPGRPDWRQSLGRVLEELREPVADG